MAEEKKHKLTREYLKSLEDELYDLEVNKQIQNSKDIEAARALGDLSENAEYDAAKDEQRDIAARIQHIKSILGNYEIIETSGDGSTISLGSTVKVRDVELKEDYEYKIVGSVEASILENKISDESPLGKALIGAKEGATVKVDSPAGILKYKVLSFTN
ncbi:MAG: transcription elongation factor GreA [Eubacterium sp.]|nr:transcription elongation factor GreA [Eubacterium sp.]